VLLAIALMMLAMPMARHRFQALIGGITGDTLGAFNQVTEALTLMAFVGAARLPVL
jgi:cobalamin synthase